MTPETDHIPPDAPACADPLDKAARHINGSTANWALVTAGGLRGDFVNVHDAKRIRDEAVAVAFGEGQRHGYDAAQSEAAELLALARRVADAVGTTERIGAVRAPAAYLHTNEEPQS